MPVAEGDTENCRYSRTTSILAPNFLIRNFVTSPVDVCVCLSRDTCEVYTVEGEGKCELGRMWKWL